MRFVTYQEGDGCCVGVQNGESVIGLKEIGLDFDDMVDFIAAYTPDVKRAIEQGMAGKSGRPLSAVKLCAPIPYPRHDIICIGQNYVEHALESARYAGREWVKPDYPIYFSKRVLAAVPPDGIIPVHAGFTEKLDYEAELAVVIGRECRHASPETAFSYVFGYTIVNDVSARDVQTRHSQWMFGKGFDGSAPMGPAIVTIDEFATPPHLAVSARVNGELRQNSNTNDFIFDIPRLISELSSGMTLVPGDIIITGTPSGVGMGFNPPKFLKAGDVVECEVEGIGILRNTVG